MIGQNNQLSDAFCYFCMQIRTNEAIIPVYSSSFLLARVHSVVHVCYCYSLLRGRIYGKVTPSNIGRVYWKYWKWTVHAPKRDVLTMMTCNCGNTQFCSAQIKIKIILNFTSFIKNATNIPEIFLIFERL